MVKYREKWPMNKIELLSESAMLNIDHAIQCLQIYINMSS